MKALSLPWISSSKPAPTLMPSHGLSPAQQVVVAVVVEVAVALAAVEEVHLPPQPVELLLLLVAVLAVVELPLLPVVASRWWRASYRSRCFSGNSARRPQSVAAVPAAAVKCPAPMWCPI